MKKIGIICASDDELEPFLPHIEHVTVSKKAMLAFYDGQISGVAITALYSGVCKVNAAIAAQLLIDSYHVDAIINAGTAGGMDSAIQLFDTVISTQTAYHDVASDILTEFHPWLSSIYFPADKDLLQIAADLYGNLKNVHFGRMVTGESFIEDHQRDEINEAYSPLSVDMETASIAHVCYVNNIPFLAVRSITDTPEHLGLEHFEKNCRQASAIAKDLVLAILAEIGR